jgi:DNA/RNA endonuclease YhcR with UshA esterase domain
MTVTVSESSTDFDIEPGSNSFVLNEGQSKQVRGRFCPQSAGAKSTSLTFTATGATNSPQTRTIQGTGVSPILRVDPSSSSAKNFGNIGIGSCSDYSTMYTVYNDGAGAMNVTVSESSPDFEIHPDDINFVLNGGQSKQVRGRFCPQSAGAKSTSLTFTATGATNSPQTRTIQGTGVSPILRVDPSSSSAKNFGSVCVGSCSDYSTMYTVYNDGAGAMTVTVSESSSDFDIESGSNSFVLNGGQSKQVRGRFCPQSAGAKSTSLTFTATGATNSPQTRTIQGTGVSPILRVDPSSSSAKNFGNIGVSSCSDYSTMYTVYNDGACAMTVTVSESSTDFDIEPGSNSFVLNEGQSKQVRGRFCPQSAGAKSTSLTFTATGATNSPQTRTIQGTGVSPILRVDPSSSSAKNFGNIGIGSCSDYSTMYTVYNDGAGAMNVTVSESSPDFEIHPDDINFVLNGGQSKQVRGRFCPQSAGAKSTSLTFTATGATNSPQTRTIQGTGVSPILRVDPSSASAFQFGSVGVNECTDYSIMYTVYNDGMSAVTVQVSENSPDFEVYASDVSFVLNSGQSKQVKGRFCPKSAGAKSTQLTFTETGATGSTQTRTIQGTGNDLPNNFEITLYKVTSPDGGTRDTDKPGTDKFTFKEGETARFTFKVNYSSTENITGIIAFEVFDPTGKSIFDSNPNNLKAANLVAGEGQVKYYSIDWFVSYGGVYGEYGIGAALRNKDNFNLLYDETFPGANTTSFATGWINEKAFAISKEVTDVTPPDVEVFKTYQTGDGRLKVIAKITDANSGVNDNSIILKTRSYPGNWTTIGREVKMTPVNGYPGFFTGDSYQYESGNYILWQITAKDNKGNTFNYPKDIGYNGGSGYVISPQEIDPDFNKDWCLRVQIQDVTSLQNQKYFHFTQKPSGSITFTQSGGAINLFNNTTIWYELETVPNITNKGTSLVDQIFHCLKPGKNGVLPTSFTDAFVNSPSFVIPGTNNVNEVQLKLNRKSKAAIIMNTFDMVYLSIKPGFPLIKVNEWVEIVANVIKDDYAFLSMAESVMAGNPEDASIKLLDWIISKSEFQNKIVQELINKQLTDKPFDLVKQNLSRAIAVLTGINNRVQFLIDVFRYTENTETITLIKSSPLEFNYKTFPSSVNNNTGYKIFRNEAFNVNLLFNPIFDYKNIFKATAEIRIYSPSGHLIDISQKNTLNTTGSFSTSLQSYDITSNGSFMKIFK